MRKLSFILLFVWPILMFGQDISISSITIDDGLSQGMIFDILKDKDGFMWLATKNGLNRYDGYDFKVYTNDPFDSLSIAGDVVLAILEDSKGRFWVSTESNGLNYFDKETETFHPVNLDSVDDKNLKVRGRSISTIKEDVHGNIWVKQKDYLLKLEITDFQQQIKTGFSAKIFPDNWLRSILDKKGELWVANPRSIGIVRWNNQIQDFVPVPNISNGRILGPTSDALMWVYENKTFYQVNETGIKTFPLKNPPKPTNTQKLLVGNFFSYNSILEKYVFDEAHSPQFYTVDFAADTEQTQLTPLFSLEKKEHVISHYQENETTSWIGTNGYGVRKLVIKPKVFRHLLPNKSIQLINNLGNGKMIISTYPTKYLVDIQSGGFSTINKHHEFSLFVSNTLKSKKQGYWAGMIKKMGIKQEENFLVKLDDNFKEVKRYSNKSLELYGFKQEDNAGNVWIPQVNHDFAKLDIELDSLLHFDCSEHGLSSDKGYAQCLYLDGQGNLWKGMTNGLMKLELNENGQPINCLFFQTDPTNKNSLRNNSVASCLDDPLDPDTYLWVGTKGGGLNKLNKKTGQFEYFTTEDGLPNNVVYGILPDKENKLWLSTNKGLSQFDPVQKTFKNYRATDGLQDDEFNTNACWKNEETGELFFGGINGITAFFPKDIKINEVRPNIYITDFKIHNETVFVGKQLKEQGENPLKKAIQFTEKINLAWHQNQLSFQFAALDYDAPEKNQYKFKLSIVNQDWVIADKSRIANYANLGPGNYVFEVMGSNSSGVWNETPTQLHITIHPPWWRTWWAYMGYIALIGFSFFQFYQFQIRRAKLKNQLLAEKKEAERLAEMDAMKTNFFANVSHELRTPLTLILSPLDGLLKNEDLSNKGFTQVKTIQQNGQNLLKLTNEILDLTKLESSKIALNEIPIALYPFIQRLVSVFETYAQKKGINLSLEYTADPQLQVNVDKNKLEKIVNNLLSNAVKFTPPDGAVKVILADLGNALQIDVTDTGRGIHPDDLPHIFNRFYQSKQPNFTTGGTGIGLAMAQEFAKLFGEDITVESDLDKGSTFSFSFPKKEVMRPLTDEDLLVIQQLAKPLTEVLPSVTRTEVREEITSPNFHSKTSTILIVEDNQQLRSYIHSLLGNSHHVFTAENGQDALDWLNNQDADHYPDLIISDIMMPIMDGFQLLKTLKASNQYCSIPIVMLTARVELEDKLTALRIGVDDYIIKPFVEEELLARVENLLTNAKVRRQLITVEEPNEQDISEKEETITPERPTNQEDLQWLAEMEKQVLENLPDFDFNLDRLSEMIYLSPRQIRRRLKQLTGLSFNHYLKEARFSKARQLLEKGEVNSVKKLAYEIGMRDVKYFSQQFKVHFGKPPSAYLG